MASSSACSSSGLSRPFRVPKTNFFGSTSSGTILATGVPALAMTKRAPRAASSTSCENTALASPTLSSRGSALRRRTDERLRAGRAPGGLIVLTPFGQVGLFQVVQGRSSVLPAPTLRSKHERRHRRRDDVAAVVGRGPAPKIVPDTLDRGGALADDARQDRLLQRHRNGAQSRPEREQIAHSDDASLGLRVENKDSGGSAEGMALEPRRLRPGDAEEGGDGQVGHEDSSGDESGRRGAFKRALEQVSF